MSDLEEFEKLIHAYAKIYAFHSRYDGNPQEMIASYERLINAYKNKNGWLAIESAPKDGTWIIGHQLYGSIDRCVQVMFWDEIDNEWVDPSLLETLSPTHWMPIPELPEKE